MRAVELVLGLGAVAIVLVVGLQLWLGRKARAKEDAAHAQHQKNVERNVQPVSLHPAVVGQGEHGPLDSLKLVELLVVAEQRIEDEFAVSLVLADEHALARSTSPFRSVATLAEYVEERLVGEGE